MTERPILMSAPMVRAILRDESPKTQTRRVIRPQPTCLPSGAFAIGEWHNQPAVDGTRGAGWAWVVGGCVREQLRCPYGAPGDHLVVRETFALGTGYEGAPPSAAPDFSLVWYRADGTCRHRARSPGARRGRWRPSIHMPRWASRIQLRVTDVRVERVQAITEGDALAEGIPPDALPGATFPDRPLDAPWCPRCDGHGVHAALGDLGGVTEVVCLECDTAVKLFRNLWDSINAKRGFGWDSNPWVWAVTFERVRP